MQRYRTNRDIGRMWTNGREGRATTSSAAPRAPVRESPSRSCDRSHGLFSASSGSETHSKDSSCVGKIVRKCKSTNNRLPAQQVSGPRPLAGGADSRPANTPAPSGSFKQLQSEAGQKSRNASPLSDPKPGQVLDLWTKSKIFVVASNQPHRSLIVRRLLEYEGVGWVGRVCRCQTHSAFVEELDLVAEERVDGFSEFVRFLRESLSDMFESAELDY